MSLLSTTTNVRLATAASGFTITRPAGAGASHVLVAAMGTLVATTGDPIMSAPSGWTRVTQLANPDFPYHVAIFVAPGDVSNLTFVTTTFSDVKIGCAAFAGRATPAADVDITNITTGTTLSVPAMTAATADTDWLGLWVDGQTGIGGPMGSAPGGVTEFMNDNTGGDTWQFCVATGVGFSAGTVGPYSRSCADGTAKTAAGILLSSGGATVVPMGARIFVNG